LVRKACSMLLSVRDRGPAWKAGLPGLHADLAVLLEDAVRMYCHAISPGYAEVAGGQQPARWAELLVVSPEQCDEILAQIAAGASLPPEAVPGPV